MQEGLERREEDEQKLHTTGAVDGSIRVTMLGSTIHR